MQRPLRPLQRQAPPPPPRAPPPPPPPSLDGVLVQALEVVGGA